MSERRRKFSFEILAALAVSLLLNLPAMICFFRTGGLSPNIFSDGDEALYLPFAAWLGKLPFGELIAGLGHTAHFQNSYLPLGFPTPHNLAELVTGKLAAILGLEPAGLGLFLDITLSFTCYLIFHALFSALSGNNAAAHCACVCLLCFPPLFPLSRYIPNPAGWPVAIFPIENFFCLPILRGVSTQLSYPLFGGTLLLVFGNKRYDYSLIGASCAALLYVYFFSWVAITAFVVIYLIACGPRRSVANDGLRFFVPFCVVSAPGLFWILEHQISQFKQPELIGATPWYFPLEIIALGAYCGHAVFCQGSANTLLRAIFALCLTELLAGNIQKVAGVSLQPYHFTSFYLHPLLAAVLILAGFQHSRSSFARLFAVLIFAAFSAVAVSKSIRALSPTADENSFAAAARFIIANTSPDDSIAVLPFTPPFAKVPGGLADVRLMPYWVWAITGRFTLPRALDQVRRREQLEIARELLVGWLFSGKVQLTGDCPSGTENPSAMLAENFSWHRKQREIYCRQAEKQISDFSPCEALKTLSIQYLLLERDQLPEFSRAERPVWRSEDSKLELLRFNAARACP